MVASVREVTIRTKWTKFNILLMNYSFLHKNAKTPYFHQKNQLPQKLFDLKKIKTCREIQLRVSIQQLPFVQFCISQGGCNTNKMNKKVDCWSAHCYALADGKNQDVQRDKAESVNTIVTTCAVLHQLGRLQYEQNGQK